MDTLKNIAFQIKNNGITGAHDLIFLTRYAFLADDRRISDAIDETLEEMSSLPADAFLAYAYGEYYEFSKKEYCPAAADFILQRIINDNSKNNIGPLTMAYARCAAAFGKINYLEAAVSLAGKMAESGGIDADLQGLAFASLGFVEMFRTTLSSEYLQAAEMFGEIIYNNFRELFQPDKAYDLEGPCANSAVAVLYDSLYGYTGKTKWEKARKTQNDFISRLADKYPESLSFALCALLADEFGRTRVLCEIPEGETPKEVQTILSVYSPNTYITVRNIPAGEKTGIYLMEKGEKKKVIL